MEEIAELRRLCGKYELAGREILAEYSDAELAGMYNGAGPDAWPDDLRGLLTRAMLLFKPAVLIHDVQYTFSDGTETGFAQTVSDWLRQAVTRSAELFEPAALIHDLEYFIGGDETDFTAANERFRRNCGRLVKAEYPWWSPLRYVWLNKARRWANYCQLFGWDGFHKKEEASDGNDH